MYKYILRINIMSKRQGVIKDFVVCHENTSPLYPASLCSTQFTSIHIFIYTLYTKVGKCFSLYIYTYSSQ